MKRAARPRCGFDPTVANATKTTGVLGYAFSYGIAPIKVKTVLPNGSARVQSHTGRPAFYFYFNQSNTSLSGSPIDGVWLPGAVTSPNEFSLVRFEIHHGEREAVLGQVNLISGFKSGVAEGAQVAFTYDDISPGVFAVTPSANLPIGQYGFVYSATGAGVGFGGLPGARIFDFAVVDERAPVPYSKAEAPAVAAPAPASDPGPRVETIGATPNKTAKPCGLRSPTSPVAVSC